MISARVKLVSAEVVATINGISCEAVHQRVDTDGGWTWVFNVGTGGERALRFWRRELIEPPKTRGLELDTVIAQIAPPRVACGWQKWEVGNLLRVSRRHLADLNLPFQKRASGMFVSQNALTGFFRRRWLFASVPDNLAFRS